MGYFSDLDLDIREENARDLRMSFEDQMLCRYEDLKNRYIDMQSGEYSYVGDDLFSREDYLYAPIERFETLYDVAKAMEFVREELEIRGCELSFDDEPKRELGMSERDPDQITVFEIIYMPTEAYAAAVA